MRVPDRRVGPGAAVSINAVQFLLNANWEIRKKVKDMKPVTLTAVAVFLAGAQLFAQESGVAESSAVNGSTGEMNAPDALDVIFSNLGPSRDDLYTWGE